MYTTPALIAAYLKRELSNNEELTLVTLIPAVKIWLDAKLGSTFDSASATTRYFDVEPGCGRSLSIDPCTTITAVLLLDNDGNTDTTYTTLTDYVAEPINETVKRELVKRGGHWQPGQRRIAVTAIFSEFSDGVPYDIELAATSVAASLLASSAQQSNVQSESLEGHNITYTNDTIDKVGMQDPMVQSLLDQRREILLG